MNRDDRIYPLTRWVIALIVPFLIAAFGILYLFPDRTAELFAWTINPRMTPLLMGAGYIAGAYFFIRTLIAARWHHVTVGFLPVALFAASMGLATLLHWDRFNHGHPSFYTWTILYATTPFIVAGLWFYNRRADPGVPERDDVLIPRAVRWTFALAGAATLLVGALLFIFPALLLPYWPWQLTPLTARVGGGWLVMPGVFALLIARDGRWSAARLALESLGLSFGLLLLALPRGWGDFDPANPLTWAFAGGTLLTLLAIIVLYVTMEARRAQG